MSDVMKFAVACMETKDWFLLAVDKREAVLARIEHARYVRDITIQAKEVATMVFKIKNAIKVGGK